MYSSYVLHIPPMEQSLQIMTHADLTVYPHYAYMVKVMTGLSFKQAYMKWEMVRVR
jgi:hypothetical protein